MKKKQPIEGPDRLLSGDPDGLLTPDEVAAVLRCSKKTVLRHVNGQSDPIIPHVQIGRRYTIRRRAVVEFIKQSESAGTAA